MNVETQPSDRLYWWVDNFEEWQSFGHVATHLAKAMEKRGVESVFSGARGRQSEFPDPWVQKRCVASEFGKGVWSLQVSSPQTAHAPRKRTVQLSSWDSNGLRPDQIKNLNATYGVAAPSAFYRDIWRGLLDVKVEAIPHGVDLDVYFPTTEPTIEPFIFGAAGRLSHGPRRKNLAFLAREFAAMKDAGQIPGSRLWLKVTPGDNVDAIPKRDDIAIFQQVMSPEAMAEWYRSLSVFVLPSCGECWGLHAHQAMACGRAVIATKWGGHTEYWGEECGWALAHTMEDAGDPGWSGTGQWAPPTSASLRHALHHAFMNPFYLVDKGRISAEYASRWTWDVAAEKLHTFLVEVGMLAPYANFEDRAWHFRPGSNDAKIFHHALEGNEYDLPERFNDGDVVIDLGCHVGGFSINAALRGAHVRAVEADPEAASLAAANVEAAGVRHAVKVCCAAACGESEATPWAGIFRVPKNTGANWTETDQSAQTHLWSRTIGLDELMRGFDGRVAFLKLDIEGAEIDVLNGCSQLDRIDRIAGEYHRVQKVEPRLIKELLESRGFEVFTHSNPECGLVGWFHARRAQ